MSGNIIEDAVNQANANYGMGVFDQTDEIVSKFYNSAAFRSEKFSQANSEANQERRTSEIERIAAESMLEGGEFYPFTKENFAEAVRNMPDESLERVRQDVLHFMQVGGYLPVVMPLANDYWKKCALFDAAAKYKD